MELKARNLDEKKALGYSWLLDPIDGTKSFVQGVPLYGVLLAREGAEGVDVGVCICQH